MGYYFTLHFYGRVGQIAIFNYFTLSTIRLGGHLTRLGVSPSPQILSLRTVKLTYCYLLETEMVLPLMLITATTEIECTLESPIAGLQLGSGITCVSCQLHRVVMVYCPAEFYSYGSAVNVA